MVDQDKPKRSRFDQTEPAKKSRFDRRSRSPPRVKSSEENSDNRASSQTSGSAAAAAGKYSILSSAHHKLKAVVAAAAAKINAHIQAQKGIQHVDVPPIKNVCDMEMPLASAKISNSRSLRRQ